MGKAVVLEQGHDEDEREIDLDDYDPEEEGAIGYALAIDTDEHMASRSQDEIAREILMLAEAHNLTPSVALFFEEEND